MIHCYGIYTVIVLLIVLLSIPSVNDACKAKIGVTLEITVSRDREGCRDQNGGPAMDTDERCVKAEDLKGCTGKYIEEFEGRGVTPGHGEK